MPASVGDADGSGAVVVTPRSRDEDQFTWGRDERLSPETLARAVRATFTNRGFWRLQLLTVAVVLVHFLLEVLHYHNVEPIEGFASDSLLIFPVLVASTRFGAVGALATSLWGSAACLLVEVGEVHTVHQIWAEWTILGVITVAAFVLGVRDDRARRQHTLLELAIRGTDIAVWEYDLRHDTLRHSANHDGLYGLAPQRGWRLEAYLNATHPDDAARTGAIIERAMSPEGPDVYAYDFRVLWPDGSVHWLWLQGTVTTRDASGWAQVVRGTLIDVTPRKEAELANERLRMLYAALSECNQAVVLARDDEDLFDRIVQGTVRADAAAMAWVGLFDDARRLARPVASAGHDAQDFLAARASIVAGIDTADTAAWPATEAASTGDIVLRDLACDDPDELSRVAAAHGWRSLAAVPVRRRGEVVAAVSLYSPLPGFFDASLRPLLEEMATDLSFALDRFDDERRQRAAELARREADARFRAVTEQSMMGIYVTRHGLVEFANPQAAALLGYDAASSMLGASVAELDHRHADLSADAASPYVPSERERVVVATRADGTPGYLWISTVPIEESDPDLELSVIGDVTAIMERGRDAAEHLREMEATLHATVAMATTIGEQRDPYTAGHQNRVAAIAAAIGQALGLDDDVVTGLRIAGELHDIGKISIPAEILTRPGRLSDTERRLIQLHPQAGYDILRGIPFRWPVALVALQHHERVDGSGYPQGLTGAQMTLEARIVAVADVVEAMASHRPYRAALGIERALDEIENGAGTRYDPEVAHACLALARAGRLPL